VAATVILRTRIHPRRKALPFPIMIATQADLAPPIEHVAEAWGQLDQEDFSHLDQR
jgi:hypothetical protein